MKKNSHKNCGYCLKPKINDDCCDSCSSNEVIYSTQYYTIKQWEWFVESLSGGCVHDFNPWEFDAETGCINRNNGFSGLIGPNNPKPPKRKYNNRKQTKARKNIKYK